MRAAAIRLLDWLRPKVSPAADDRYRVFTRDFDVIADSKELDRVLGPLPTTKYAAHEEAWQIFSDGLLGWRTEVHLVALAASARIRNGRDAKSLSDTTVSILIDQSGSMRGQSMLLAAATADVMSDFLCHLGVAVEVLGFTTTSWKGGKSRQLWIRRGRPPGPGRLCDLLHLIYRTAGDTRASTGGVHFKPMLRPDLPKENVDGEALLWAAERLRARSQSSKILLVVSDGAPVDDSTLSANGLDFLDQHLRQVISDIEAASDIRLVAAGIGFDVGRYYGCAVSVNTPDDLGEAVIGLLENTLLEKPPNAEPLTFA